MMQIESEKTTCSQKETAPVNVLFVGNRPISEDLANLLDEGGYSWEMVGIEAFESCVKNRDIHGTVVIDAELIRSEQIQRFQELFEQLDARDVALICYHCPEALKLDHLKLASKACSIQFEELWARIESNVRFFQRLQDDLVKEHNHCQSKLNEDTAEQLEMAGQVQRNFLPEQLPNSDKIKFATVFRPAEWVSGDIYDIARLDEEHIGFYLADAVGHSMPAALLTMFLKQVAIMRQTIENKYYIFNPCEVIKNMNVRMAQQELNGCLFATCSYGLLNMQTLTLQYARAGHPYAILIRNNELIQLQSRGGLLGVFAEADFEQKEIQLITGDKLFIYSDGGEPLIGEGNEDGTMNFTDAFKQICTHSIEDMMNAYNDMAEHHTFGPGEIDDVTAIGLEIL